MTAKTTVFCLGLILSTLSHAFDVTRLPFWNIDFTQVRCSHSNGASQVFFDGTQTTWIRSAQLTRLMAITAQQSHYKVEIASAVYVNRKGDMVFLGYSLDGSRRFLALNTFSFGAFSKSKNLDLLAQHGVTVSGGKILWPHSPQEECVFEAIP